MGDILYYKIIDQNSPTYKNAMAYIAQRKSQKDKNWNAVREYTGIKFTDALIHQPGFNCLPIIVGIQLPKGATILEGWKPSKDDPTIIVPNLRTSAGKAAQQFINNLPNWSYKKELELFGIKKSFYGRFSLPWLSTGANDETIICVALDVQFEKEGVDGMIEITRTEFYALAEKVKKSKKKATHAE